MRSGIVTKPNKNVLTPRAQGVGAVSDTTLQHVRV